MVYAFKIFIDLAKSPSIGVVPTYPLTSNVSWQHLSLFGPNCPLFFWVPCCGLSKACLFWPSFTLCYSWQYTRIEVAGSQPIDRQICTEYLLQIQHCPRHIGCIAGFGKLRCSEKELTPQEKVAAFKVVRTTYSECCASSSGRTNHMGEHDQEPCGWLN